MSIGHGRLRFLEPLLGAGRRVDLHARARRRVAANACFVFGGIWTTEVGVTATSDRRDRHRAAPASM